MIHIYIYMILINNEKHIRYMYIPSLSESYINEILIYNNFVSFFNNYNMTSYLNPYNENDLKYIIKYGIYRYVINILMYYNLYINEDIIKGYDVIIIIENPYIKFINNIINIKTQNNIQIAQYSNLNIYNFLCLIPSQTYYYNIKNNYYYTYKFIINKNEIVILEPNNNKTQVEDIDIKYKPIIEEIKNANINNNQKELYKKYTQELLNFANKIYSDDFETFGYKKCETIEELINYYIQ